MVRKKQGIVEVALDMIERPEGRIRMEINQEGLEELASSIEQIGLMQPICVRPKGEKYEIVAGERRYLAHRFLGLKKIKATVGELSDADTAVARAAENLQRVDLSPLEEAAIYSELMESHGLSAEQIGKRVGKKGGTVLRRLNILKMRACLQKAIHMKRISVSAAEELSRIEDDSDLEYYLSYAVDGGATQMTCREWAQEARDRKRRGESVAEGGSPPSDPYRGKPVYVTCDLCHGPMTLGDETVLRICEECGRRMQKALEERG